jgi:hypothetical protein
MNRFRLVGIVLFSIGWAVLISGAVITKVLANANPDYNYSSYTGFRFPNWLYFAGSMIGWIGFMLIFGNRYSKKSKTKQTPS